MKKNYERPQSKEINLWLETDAMVVNGSNNLIAPAEEDEVFDM